MALKLKFKTPVVTKPTVNIAVCEKADLIDEIGDLLPQVAKIDAEIERLNELRKPFEDRMKELTAFATGEGKTDETVTLYGERFYVEAGKRKETLKLTDLPQAAKMLGQATFMQLAKLNVGDLRKYLTPPQLEKVTETEEGDRKVTVKPRADVEK